MCLNILLLLFFHVQEIEYEMLCGNTEPPFGLYSGLSNIFFIATNADNYTYNVGRLAVTI